jgi:hypothetical protein
MPNQNVDKKRQERTKLVEHARLLVGAANVSEKLHGQIIAATSMLSPPKLVLSSHSSHERSVRELVAGISERKWTATQTVSAYIAQAIKAHEATNCLTESMRPPCYLSTLI